MEFFDELSPSLSGSQPASSQVSSGEEWQLLSQDSPQQVIIPFPPQIQRHILVSILLYPD
jgi:hypothetical protein